jgi:2-dehydro-3-deoxyphosphooctonate aldolase (KDO 8-P synthase)
MEIIFKASYDKANRSSLKSFRGPGLKKGLKILAAIKKEFCLPVSTDVHEPAHARAAAEVVDILQIPAFLCRQTDLLVSASRTGKPVNVKKGQFMSPWDMKNVLQKLTSEGNENAMVTERGSMFGYNNLVVDFRSFPVMKSYGYPVIFDVTHSLQLPGAGSNKSGGMPEFIPDLARAAVALGIAGVFIEVHAKPEEALSDGESVLKLGALKDILLELKKIDNLIKKGKTELRPGKGRGL